MFQTQACWVSVSLHLWLWVKIAIWRARSLSLAVSLCQLSQPVPCIKPSGLYTLPLMSKCLTGMGQCPVVVWQVQTVELFSFSELADSFPVCSLHSNDCPLEIITTDVIVSFFELSQAEEVWERVSLNIFSERSQLVSPFPWPRFLYHVWVAFRVQYEVHSFHPPGIFQLLMHVNQRRKVFTFHTST